MNELVSIIVPAYNAEAYLNRCIDSILSQTYKNIEIILVDDGSTDNTPVLCDEYSEQYKDIIKVIHKENGGVSSARNIGIETASGDYYAFVDSDDWIADDFIETLYSLIKRNNCEISIVNLYLSYPDGKQVVMYSSADLVMCKDEFLHELFLQDKFGGMACQKMFKKEIFNSIRFPDYVKYEDMAISLECFLLCKKIALCSKPKYYYFQRLHSAINSEFTTENLHLLDNIKVFMDYSHKNGGKYDQETEALYLKSILLLLMQLCVTKEPDIKAMRYLEGELRLYRKKIWRNQYIELKKKIMLYLIGNRVSRRMVSSAWNKMMLRRLSSGGF